MDNDTRRIGEILVSKGLLNDSDLESALREQKLTQEFIGTILIRNRYVDEKDLLAAVSEQCGMPIMSIKDLYIDWNLVKKFNSSVILQDRCFPVSRDAASVTIAILNPLDAWALKRAADAAAGLRVNFVLVTHDDMEEIMKRYKQFIRKTVTGLLD